MKTIQVKLKTLILLVLVSFIFISCGNDKKEGQKDLKKQMDELEDDNSFAGSSKRDDICKLLTKKDILSAFELSEEIEIKQSEDRNAICSYKWQTMDEKYNTVMLNFASGGKRTKSQIDKAWKKQNKSVYKKHKPQNVSDVGDRASWSGLGGGQLRVAADGYIFYVSHSVMVMPGEEKPKDTQGMIDKTSTLAKQVIERM